MDSVVQGIKKKKGLISLSGGMDSTTVLYWAVKQGYDMSAIAFNYGQNHIKEIEYAKYHCDKLNVNFQIIELDFLKTISNSSLTAGSENIPEGHYAEGNMKSTVVPFRNGIFLSVMTAYAEANNIKNIFLGNHKGDHDVYPDCRKTFTDAFKNAAKFGTYNEVEFIAPFVNMSKSYICSKGIELGVSYDKTWSCYKGKMKPCGKCGTCVERVEAFYDNNLKDPLVDSETWEKFVKNYQEVMYQKEVSELRDKCYTQGN